MYNSQGPRLPEPPAWLVPVQPGLLEAASPLILVALAQYYPDCRKSPFAHSCRNRKAGQMRTSEITSLNLSKRTSSGGRMPMLVSMEMTTAAKISPNTRLALAFANRYKINATRRPNTRLQLFWIRCVQSQRIRTQRQLLLTFIGISSIFSYMNPSGTPSDAWNPPYAGCGVW